MPLRLKVNQKEFNQALQLAARVVPARPPFPVLGGILLEADAGAVWISATDLEVSLRVRFPAEVLHPGRVVLPGHHTAELVRHFPETELELEEEPNALTVRYHRGRNEIATMEPGQFPVFPAPEDGPRITLSSDQWLSVLRQVAIACAHDEVQPMFGGVLWELGPDRPLSFVATDTHRLAWLRTELVPPVENQIRAIVPRRAMEIAARLAQAAPVPLEVRLGPHQISLEGEDFLLLSRLLEGRYPSYQAVIPRELGTGVRVEISPLVETLERAAVLVREEEKNRANIVRLQISAEGLTVSGRSTVGSLLEPVAAEVEGSEGEVFFNVRYLLEGLRALDGERAFIGFSRDFSAAVLRAEGDEGYVHLILPVVVQGGPVT
ncbi:MAG: DNA polymerase III subunit beta [Moorellales bacterium]